MRKHLCTLVLCAIVSPATAVWAQVPKPSIAQKSWQLRFRYEDPQRVSVFVPGQAEPVLYWYMLYRVENSGETEVDFYPQFDLVTDTLKVYRSASRVSAEPGSPVSSAKRASPRSATSWSGRIFSASR